MLRFVKLFNRPKKNSKIVFQVELTNHCNFSCPFCPQSIYNDPLHKDNPFDRKKGFMSEEVFLRLIEVANKHAHSINFSFFGEQTMHPKFFHFMTLLKDKLNKSIKVVMNSNLSFFTKDHFQVLIKAGFSELRLSVDAVTDETFSKTRPGTVLNLEGKKDSRSRMELINEKLDYWFSLPDHIPSRHVFTVCETNRKDLEGFVKRWQSSLGDEDIILAKNVLTYGGKLENNHVKENPCKVWTRNELTVSWDGRITACNLDVNMDLSFSSIDEIDWMSYKKMQGYIKIETASKERRISPCITCVDANNWSKNIAIKRDSNVDEINFTENFGF